MNRRLFLKSLAAAFVACKLPVPPQIASTASWDCATADIARDIANMTRLLEKYSGYPATKIYVPGNVRAFMEDRWGAGIIEKHAMEFGLHVLDFSIPGVSV